MIAKRSAIKLGQPYVQRKFVKSAKAPQKAAAAPQKAAAAPQKAAAKK